MRKKVSLFLILALMVMVFVPVTQASEPGIPGHDVTVIVDGKTLSDKGYIKQARTMVPLRAISEAFDFRVEWVGNEAKHPIQIYPKVPGVEIKGIANDFGYFAMKPGDRNLYIMLRQMKSDGSRVATGEMDIPVGNSQKSGDVAPELKSGRTYVPIRLIAETFGCSVDWNPATRTATIGKFYPETIMDFAKGWTPSSSINKYWKQDLVPREIYFKEDNGLLTIYVCSRAINAADVNTDVPIQITAKGQNYMTKEGYVFHNRDTSPSIGAGSKPITVPISKGETIEIKATIDPNQDFFDVDRNNNTITRTYTSKG